MIIFCKSANSLQNFSLLNLFQLQLVDIPEVVIVQKFEIYGLETALFLDLIQVVLGFKLRDAHRHTSKVAKN